MKRVSVEELKEMIDQKKDILLLDVREQDEREICTIDYEEIWISISEIPLRAEEVPRDREIIVYCHHGVRSGQVVGYLEARHGYDKLANLSGGIDAWAIQIDPEMRKY